MEFEGAKAPVDLGASWPPVLERGANDFFTALLDAVRGSTRRLLPLFQATFRRQMLLVTAGAEAFHQRGKIDFVSAKLCLRG